MCGLTGYLDGFRERTEEESERTVRDMASTLRHRGPDDSGAWVDAEAGIALGHCRLSIVDLSSAGHQPMCSKDGRFVIAYNGEIYNAVDLARELTDAGCALRGHSDTEVLVEACARWGVEPTIRRLVGMFAFALWDREKRCLVLARDRLGIKPLYWTKCGGTILFASELKGLAAYPGFQADVCRDSLAAFMRFGYVPAPNSIYRGVFKLEPGCLLRLLPGTEPEISRYWDLRAIALAGVTNPLELRDDEAVEALGNLLGDAVQKRLVSDVPVGAFLSGGLDSSTVVALMRREGATPTKTFTIGFHSREYNEAEHAKAVARHLETEHTELYLTEGDALQVIPDLPHFYDEPFADSSQIPTSLVSRLARGTVTVALSGDGGDELFGGYNRHALGTHVGQNLLNLPGSLRRAASTTLGAVPVGAWRLAESVAMACLPDRVRARHIGDKVQKLARILAVDDPEQAYWQLAGLWTEGQPALGCSAERTDFAFDGRPWPSFGTFAEQMMLRDAEIYLPDDILTKVDRASMAVGLELRVPFLDHRVVEFAWRLPVHMKIRNGRGKWLVRQLLASHVPLKLTERPKAGFAVPIHRWLRTELRDWAENLLSESRLRRDGLLDPAPIRAAWAAHLSGRRDEQHRLWAALMFQAWHEHWHH